MTPENDDEENGKTEEKMRQRGNKPERASQMTGATENTHDDSPTGRQYSHSTERTTTTWLNSTKKRKAETRNAETPTGRPRKATPKTGHMETAGIPHTDHQQGA